MAAIPLTKNQVAIVDEKEFEYLAKFKWYCSTKGYAVRDIVINGKKKCQWMHRIVSGAVCGVQVDHINHNKLDNRKENLRFCNNQKNHFNSPPQKGGSSKYKGVHWDSKSKKWRAQIHLGDRKKSLGSFKDEEDAALAYNEGAKKYFSEFAHLNKI